MTHGFATYGDDPEFDPEYPENPEGAAETRRDIDELFTAVDGLQNALSEAGSRDRGLRREFAELAEKLERRDGGVRRYENRLDLLGRQLERLTQQFQTLDRAVRVSEGVPVVDLDDVGAETRALAAEAARWDTLHNQLVTKEERGRHEQELERLEQVRQAHAQCEADLIDVITTLSATKRGSVARGHAESEFGELTGRRRALLDEEIPAAIELAEVARKALDQADAIEARVLPQLDRSERAWHDLQLRLRTRVTDAIGSSALLPTWFGHALGVAPPSGAAGDEWIRTAASVLAYRAIYGIDDQARPLGEPAPDDADVSERRWTWRATLESELDALSL